MRFRFSLSRLMPNYGPILALLLTTQCLAGPVWIPTESMVPTMLVGDVLLVNRLAYNFHLPVFSTAEAVRWATPARGDIILFNAPPTISALESIYIKRVAAVAGDTIQVRGQRVILNGKLVPYAQVPLEGATETLGDVTHKVLLAPGPFANFGPVVVPAGHVFVLGDNRDNSADSRVWGPLALERVRGKAIMRVAGLAPSNLQGPGGL